MIEKHQAADPPLQWQPTETAVKQHLEQDANHEHGKRNPGDGDASRYMINNRIAPYGGDYAHRDAHQDNRNDRKNGQLQGGGRADRNIRDHGLLGMQADPEVTLDRVTQEVQVLDVQWQIEAERRARGLDLLLIGPVADHQLNR